MATLPGQLAHDYREPKEDHPLYDHLEDAQRLLNLAVECFKGPYPKWEAGRVFVGHAIDELNKI